MGIDIHTYIIRKVANGWKDICLYRKAQTEGEFEIVSPYDQRNYELFDLLNHAISSSALDFDNIDNYPNRIVTECQEAVEEHWGYGFAEINLADLKYWYAKHPPVSDEEEDTTPSEALDDFIGCIEQYVSIAEDFPECETRPSLYKIIYWFDH